MALESFIPPGQEEVVGAMLGNGAALPGDCKLATGKIEKTTVEATYACPTGEVQVALAHPDAAPSDATRTQKLAVRIERGTPPPDFQNALLSRIREHESQFRWVVYPDPNSAGQSTPAPMPVLSGALVLGVLLLVALLLWRRRSRATQD